MKVRDLPTPALVVDRTAFEANLATMAAARPGAQLRPHVKAHKCSALARRQDAIGHHGFTAATPREIVGLASAGLGADLLLANETVDAHRLRAMADCDARVTVAVDSDATIAAAEDVEEWLSERCPELVDLDGWGAIDAHERAAGEGGGRPRVKVVDRSTLMGLVRDRG